MLNDFFSITGKFSYDLEVLAKHTENNSFPPRSGNDHDCLNIDH